VKRVVHVDSDDEVEASGEDALGEIIVSGLDRLAHRERAGSYEIEVLPLGSIATLFSGEPEENNLPRFNSSWLLCDCLSSTQAGELRLEAVNRHLRVGGGRQTLEQLCFRMGLTPRSASSLIGRCPR